MVHSGVVSEETNTVVSHGCRAVAQGGEGILGYKLPKSKSLVKKKKKKTDYKYLGKTIAEKKNLRSQSNYLSLGKVQVDLRSRDSNFFFTSSFRCNLSWSLS